MPKIVKDHNHKLKDIWKIFTDVQEQMVQLRSARVSIIPDSAKIVREKLFLIADENDKIDKVIDKITSTFQLSSDEIDIGKGSFFADVTIAKEVGEETKRHLSEKAAANFINFQPFPIIDGYVNEKKSPVENLIAILEKSNYDYSFDRKDRLQITIADLFKLDKLTSDKRINIQIPEIASVILQVRPNPLFFLIQRFPNITFQHTTQGYRRRDNDLYKDNRTIHGTELLILLMDI